MPTIIPISDKSDYVLLIVDTPKGCGDCVLNDTYNECCKGAKRRYGNSKILKDKRPDFCPLNDIYWDENIAVIPKGKSYFAMIDPKNCNACLVNDIWSHVCKVTGHHYSVGQLNNGRKLGPCPMYELVKNRYGSYEIDQRK